MAVCAHNRGWAVWRNHYSAWCASCGADLVSYNLLPFPDKHALGEIVTEEEAKSFGS